MKLHLTFLIMTGCASSQHHRNDIVEEIGASYLEGQYSSSEWLLVAANESDNEVECRLFASAAFWLEAIAESEVEYYLWMNTPAVQPSLSSLPLGTLPFCSSAQSRVSS